MDKETNYYSEQVPSILEEKGRLIIAKQIRLTLLSYLLSLRNRRCLDLGSSSGVITNYLAPYFREVVGVDVDKDAIELASKKYKRKNLKFYSVRNEKLPFIASSFDVVICNQVYEFVDSQEMLAREIYRVLKPGGICFLGARNKLTIFEGQTGIPLFHFLPVQVVKKAQKMFKISYYPTKYLTVWGLEKLFRKFLIHDMTINILRNPKRYGFSKLKKYSALFKFLPANIVYPIIPNYIWLLEKNEN